MAAWFQGRCADDRLTNDRQVSACRPYPGRAMPSFFGSALHVMLTLFVKHEGSQRIFGIETQPDGSGVVYEVDLDARRVLHGEAEKRRRQPLVRNWATSPA
jgi:hypothetical protein